MTQVQPPTAIIQPGNEGYETNDLPYVGGSWWGPQGVAADEFSR